MFMQFFVALLVILCMRVLWMRWKYDIHKIPSPPEWPLLGHTLLFLGGSGAKEITYVRAYWWKRLGWPKIIRVSSNAVPSTELITGNSIVELLRTGGALCQRHGVCQIRASFEEKRVSKDHHRFCTDSKYRNLFGMFMPRSCSM